jgi:hypothetical protein
VLCWQVLWVGPFLTAQHLGGQGEVSSELGQRSSKPIARFNSQCFLPPCPSTWPYRRPLLNAVTFLPNLRRDQTRRSFNPFSHLSRRKPALSKGSHLGPLQRHRRCFFRFFRCHFARPAVQRQASRKLYRCFIPRDKAFYLLLRHRHRTRLVQSRSLHTFFKQRSLQLYQTYISFTRPFSTRTSTFRFPSFA